nr:immunoglobulin light chain junction region [Macaca mulatta]MOX13802.1 immunoglobulin light chain junction region [Macaca mulatta]
DYYCSAWYFSLFIWVF